MNYVLPALEDRGALPSLELRMGMGHRNYGNSFPIRPFENLLVDCSTRQASTSRYDTTSIFEPAVPLIDSFYMTYQVYYICFGCGSIKDDKEWYEWRDNERLREYQIHKKGNALDSLAAL